MDNLSQGTFQFSKKVGFFQTEVFTVDVIHFKPELLHHLKIVVNDKRFGELGVQAVHDSLCPANLKRYRFQSHVPLFKVVLIFTAFIPNLKKRSEKSLINSVRLMLHFSIYPTFRSFWIWRGWHSCKPSGEPINVSVSVLQREWHKSTFTLTRERRDSSHALKPHNKLIYRSTTLFICLHLSGWISKIFTGNFYRALKYVVIFRAVAWQHSVS